MRPNLKSICALMLALPALGAGAKVAESSANRYHAIPERNVFGLKPADKQAAPAVQAAPLPKIILTGITTILGNKRALLKELPPVTKPGEHPQEIPMILTEGQREGDVEVLQIDELAGSVHLNNSGTLMTVTFEKDGPKPSNGPAPTNATPTTAVATAAPAPPSYTPPANANPGLRPFPGRAVRAAPSVPASTTPTTAPALPVGGVPSPTGLPTPPGAIPGQQQVDLPADLTPEERAIVLQLQNTPDPNSVLGLAPSNTPNGHVPASDVPVTGGFIQRPSAPILPQ